MTDALVAASRAAIARGSKSFALASRLFDPVTHDRATLLYAWCRHADDVIDGQVDGFGQVAGKGTPVERLAALETKTRKALVGDGGGGAPFAALARVAAETHLPPRFPLDLIEGFRSDVEGRRFVTEGDTLTYCYHVAGCVGAMMAVVMGVDARNRPVLDRASDLGIAFQLDNIARDVIEDAANGRCYLPEEWLAAAGLVSTCHPRESGDPSPGVRQEMGPRLCGDDNGGRYFAAPHNRAALAAVVARLVDLSDRYAASARYGTPALPWRAAWAVLAAADIYGGIGRRVRAEGVAALDRRVTTSTAEKLAAVACALPQAVNRRRRWPVPGPSRVGLWTMP